MGRKTGKWGVSQQKRRIYNYIGNEVDKRWGERIMMMMMMMITTTTRWEEKVYNASAEGVVIWKFYGKLIC